MDGKISEFQARVSEIWRIKHKVSIQADNMYITDIFWNFQSKLKSFVMSVHVFEVVLITIKCRQALFEILNRWNSLRLLRNNSISEWSQHAGLRGSRMSILRFDAYHGRSRTPSARGERDKRCTPQRASSPRPRSWPHPVTTSQRPWSSEKTLSWIFSARSTMIRTRLSGHLL